MKFTLSIAVLILSAVTANCEKARYDNYRVYRVVVESELQLKVLKELSEVSDSVSAVKFMILLLYNQNF